MPNVRNDVLMISSREREEKELFKLVAKKCKFAREVNGTTRKELLTSVWGYENNQKHANRVSELESGGKRIELITVYRICKALGVSSDFLLGLSPDFELDDYEAKTAGRVFQSVRSAVLESTEQICMQMSKAIGRLPPIQGDVLRGHARNVVDIVDKYAHDMDWCSKHPDLVNAIIELNHTIMLFDKHFARQMRFIEMATMELLDEDILDSPARHIIMPAEDN